MIRDDIQAARLQSTVDGLVHAYPVHTEEAEVVVVEHQRHEIDSPFGDLAGNRIFERALDRYDARGRHASASEALDALG